MNEPINAVCGNCAFWVLMEAARGPVEIGAKKRGICKALPPVPAPIYDAQGRVANQMHLRPTPLEDDQCGQFVPHPRFMPDPAANDG